MKPTKTLVVDGEVVRTPARVIEFNQGRYDTSDPAEIAFLRTHYDFGRFIFEAEAPAVAEVEESADETEAPKKKRGGGGGRKKAAESEENAPSDGGEE